MKDAYSLSKENGDIGMGKFDDAGSTLFEDVDKLIKPISNKKDEVHNRIIKQNRSTSLLLLVLGVIIGLFIIILGIFMSRSIISPLENLSSSSFLLSFRSSNSLTVFDDSKEKTILKSLTSFSLARNF